MENQAEKTNEAAKQLEALYAEEKILEAKKQAIFKASLDAPESEKVCPDFMARLLAEPTGQIEYPISINGIAYNDQSVVSGGRSGMVGSFVAIRPCDKELAGHTFLGVYLGDIAMSAGARYNRSTGVLEIGHSFHNPAIWVPELKRIVFGAESWWGVLEEPDDLKQITDADINDIWYVKAMESVVKPVPLDAPQA